MELSLVIQAVVVAITAAVITAVVTAIVTGYINGRMLEVQLKEATKLTVSQLKDLRERIVRIEVYLNGLLKHHGGKT